MNSENKERIVITGATGFLGSYLAAALADEYELHLTGFSHATASNNITPLDLTDKPSIGNSLNAIRPAVIIHTAALTSVDECQNNCQRAFQLNVQATRHLADWIGENSPDCRLIYISTDQLYDGSGPHSEERVAPGNIYALTKLYGEELASRADNHLILRTNFFGLASPRRNSFADWLIQNLLEERSIQLFNDVYFNPLYIDDLAQIICWFLQSDLCGRYNVGAGSALSKADFALELARVFKLTFNTPKIVSVADANLIAHRPRDMRMELNKLKNCIDFQLPTIESGIEKLHQAYRARQSDSLINN